MVLNKKISVVQVLPDLNSGGVERGTLEVNKYLASKGHRSIVISNGGRMKNQIEMDKGEHFKLPIGEKNIFIFFVIFKLIKFLKKNKIDVIHARSRLPAWVCFLALKLLKKNRRPIFITTVHGSYSVNFYSSIMTKGDKVIVVSKSIKKYVMKNYNIDERKIILNYRGVSSKDYFQGYKPTKKWLKTWYKQFPETENKILFSIPARITRWKGQDKFLLLIKKIKDINPMVYGLIIGDDQKKILFCRKLKSKIKKMGLDKNIKIVGHRTDLKEIMSISKIVFSLSSPPEAFGRVTLESLSIGTPVIAYSHGGVKEQLDELQPSGLVRIGDINHAISLSNKFLKTSPIIKKNDLFTLERMLVNTLCLYKKCVFEKNSYL